jgi:hypothetical protein
MPVHAVFCGGIWKKHFKTKQTLLEISLPKSQRYFCFASIALNLDSLQSTSGQNCNFAFFVKQV